jgi:hypothetical protein
MPSYIFKGIEMLSLMALSGFKPENHSPAWKAVDNIKKQETEDSNSALNGLSEIGMIMAGDDGKVHVSKEAAMLMKILCNPSQVTVIRRMGLSGNTEYNLLKLGNLYCVYLAVPDQDLHMCQFPLDQSLAKAWFDADILVDLPPVTARKAAASHEVNPAECALLNCIQDWYAKKAEKKSPIDEADLWFSAQELNSAFDEGSLSKRLHSIYVPEKIQIIVQNLNTVNMMEKHLKALVEAGLLENRIERGVESYCYSGFMMQFMDPMLLRDIMLIERSYPEQKISIAYMKTDGIFIMHANDSTVTFAATDIEDLKQMVV